MSDMPVRAGVWHQWGGQTCAVQEFIGLWASLLTDVLAAVPEAKGRLLVDMINEPDGYGFTWCGSCPPPW